MAKRIPPPGKGAPSGNQYGVKLKDPSIRQQAYGSYCDHLSKGKSKRSWCFEHPDFTCTWETMEKYLQDSLEFEPIQMKLSLSKGYATWEAIAEDGATGKNRRVNPACLQMVMRNKFGWDKQKEGNSEHRGDIGRLADAIRVKFEPSSDQSDSELEQTD